MAAHVTPDEIAGTGLLVAVAAWFRSSWRRWRKAERGRVEDAIDELRRDMTGRFDQLLTETRATSAGLADIRDRVTRLEAVGFDRRYRRGGFFTPR